VRAAGLDDHLTDDPLDVKEDEAMRKTWRKSDAKFMGALILKVAPSLRMSLEHHSSACGSAVSSAKWGTLIFLVAKFAKSSAT
jgi:hypothetical protein